MYTLDTEKVVLEGCMIVAFSGHSQYIRNPLDEKRVLEILEQRVGNMPCDFFLGEYGKFDGFAYDCAKKMKEKNTQCRLVFVTPYLPVERSNYALQHGKRFDCILFPEIERVPRKYAILYRNRYIVDNADILIAYVTHKYGGAYKMYQYARRKNKEIYNIAEGRGVDLTL